MAGEALKIQGSEQMAVRLEQIGVEVADRVSADAVKEAGGLIVDAYRAGIASQSVRFGLLKGAAGLALRKPRQGRPYVAIGAKRGVAQTRIRKTLSGASAKSEPANYSHLVEGGTKPHALKQVLIGRVRTFGGRLRKVYQAAPGARMHPGAKPEPSLRPAVASAGPAALERISQRLSEAIAKAGGGG